MTHGRTDAPSASATNGPALEIILRGPGESFRWAKHDYPHHLAKWHRHPNTSFISSPPAGPHDDRRLCRPVSGGLSRAGRAEPSAQLDQRSRARRGPAQSGCAGAVRRLGDGNPDHRVHRVFPTCARFCGMRPSAWSSRARLRRRRAENFATWSINAARAASSPSCRCWPDWPRDRKSAASWRSAPHRLDCTPPPRGGWTASSPSSPIAMRATSR